MEATATAVGGSPIESNAYLFFREVSILCRFCSGVYHGNKWGRGLDVPDSLLRQGYSFGMELV
jgi:hypothetical protein